MEDCGADNARSAVGRPEVSSTDDMVLCRSVAASCDSVTMISREKPQDDPRALTFLPRDVMAHPARAPAAPAAELTRPPGT